MSARGRPRIAAPHDRDGSVSLLFPVSGRAGVDRTLYRRRFRSEPGMIDRLGDEARMSLGKTGGREQEVTLSEIGERVGRRRAIPVERRRRARHPVRFIGRQDGKEQLTGADQGGNPLRPGAAGDTGALSANSLTPTATASDQDEIDPRRNDRSSVSSPTSPGTGCACAVPSADNNHRLARTIGGLFTVIPRDARHVVDDVHLASVHAAGSGRC